MERSSTSLTKILVLTTTLPTEEGDSTPSFVLDLARAVAEQMPAEVTIVAPAAPGAPPRQQFGPVAVRRFRYLPQRWAALGASTAILPALREKPLRVLQVPLLLGALTFAGWTAALRIRPDVVHTNWIVPVGVVGELVRRATPGRPAHVVTVRGSDVHALRGALWDRLRSWVTRKADLVLPVSGELAEILGLPPEQAVPMGAPPLFSEAKHQAQDDAPFLYVGRLAANKGVDVILRALAAGGGEATLRIVGEGPERARLQQLAKELGVAGRVTFCGPLPKRQVAEEMSKARALILASVESADGAREGSPNVLIEAVLVGTPIIASRIGGVPDRFEHGRTALLFEPGDHSALAGLLREVVFFPTAARLRAENAADVIGRDATSAAVGVRYMEAIGRLL